ncbi:MAG: LacI family DNA-binding transcriptional regulator [Ferruginibacter sp.]
MQKASTLKQLSKILDISVSTVSRALKNHPDISEQTKKKVRELAETLEYEPNRHAVFLRNNTSNVLGIVVPLINNFFYESFTGAVEEEARAAGYTVLIVQSGESKETELANLKLLKNNSIAGVFVSITTETEDITPFLKLQDKNIPVIFFDRVPVFEACNKICLADRRAATIAADALIVKQKKSVLALFGHPKLTISIKRFETFNEVFKTRSPTAKVNNQFPLNIADAKEMTMLALESKAPPDALFCMGDMILIGAMQAVHEKRLRIPQDISVISISNGLIPTLYDPKITFVETSGYKLGKLAFKRMIECLGGSTFMQELTVESILVEGGSL